MLSFLVILAIIRELLFVFSVSNNSKWLQGAKGSKISITGKVQYLNAKYRLAFINLTSVNKIGISGTTLKIFRLNRNMNEKLTSCQTLPGCTIETSVKLSSIKKSSGRLTLSSKAPKKISFKINNNLVWLTEYLILKISLIKSQKSRTFLEALILGIRGTEYKILQTSFMKLGLSHLLAISGLHLGMIYLSISLLQRLLFATISVITHKHPPIVTLTRLLSLLITFIYSLAIVPKVPMQRALIMLFFVVIPVKTKTITRLWVAVLTIIIIQPECLFGYSIYLSFASVLALILWFSSSKPENFKQKSIAIFIIKSLQVSFVIFCFTLPLSLMFFGKAALHGILLNIIFIPFTFLVMSAAIFLPLFKAPLEVISDWYLWTIEFFTGFNGLFITSDKIGVIEATIFYILIALVLISVRYKRKLISRIRAYIEILQ